MLGAEIAKKYGLNSGKVEAQIAAHREQVEPIRPETLWRRKRCRRRGRVLVEAVGVTRNVWRSWNHRRPFTRAQKAYAIPPGVRFGSVVVLRGSGPIRECFQPSPETLGQQYRSRSRPIPGKPRRP